MKNAFNGLISRLGIAEERTSELEDRNFQNWKVKIKMNGKNGNRMSKNCDTLLMV